MVSSQSLIEVRGGRPFVSRGGEKLRAALDFFHIRVSGRTCIDLGASTGGFTDCLLQDGALRVYAFDVGRGQIAWRLATDPRVALQDQYNVRRLRPEDIPEPFFLLAADLSFISLRLVLPAIAAVCSVRGEPDAVVLLLVKPQFELPSARIAPGGLVRHEEEGRAVVDTIAAAAAQEGFSNPQIFPSPIRGASGNQEYFLKLQLR